MFDRSPPVPALVYLGLSDVSGDVTPGPSARTPFGHSRMGNREAWHMQDSALEYENVDIKEPTIPDDWNGTSIAKHCQTPHGRISETPATSEYADQVDQDLVDGSTGQLPRSALHSDQIGIDSIGGCRYASGRHRLPVNQRDGPPCPSFSSPSKTFVIEATQTQEGASWPQ